MSSNPGGTRKRRGQQQPSATIDLTASDASRTPKRARSSAKRAAAAAAVGAVFDLTDEPAPAPQPSDSRHSGHRKSAAKPRRILKSPQLAPAPRAEPASAGSGGADQAASSRADQKAARRATKAAAVAAGTAAFIAEEASRAAEAAEAEAEPEAEADMFFRSRKREAAEPAAAAAAAVVVPAAEVAKPGDELPAWHSMKGAKRLQSEFRYLNKQIVAGKITQMYDITPIDDNIFKWQFKLKNFDNDCQGGRELNEDLSVLEAIHGQDHLLMEITFPSDYPNSPFFLRMVTPRCVWYTGHVTAGGSVCIEVLTQSGTPNSWSPAMCVESIMNTVILNMLHVESVMVRTASGPGGRSGPLRVDLQGRYAYNPLQAYSDYEARAAFSRMLSHHRSNGW